MRLDRFASVALVALLLVGCTAPAPSPDTPKTATESAPTPATPAPVAAPTQPQQPTMPEQAPVAAEHKATTDASAPSRSCKVDSDCAVKNVGNCCGAFPMCVSKDARTDPAAVQAQCAKAGVASVCGFQEVSGCQCVKGQCENLTGGAAVM